MKQIDQSNVERAAPVSPAADSPDASVEFHQADQVMLETLQVPHAEWQPQNGGGRSDDDSKNDECQELPVSEAGKT